MTSPAELRVELGYARAGFALDVALAAAPGVTVLFGPSGAGKSTLLDLIAGLLRPSRGRIALGDRTLFDAGAGVDLPPRARRVGYVFQSLALFPHMSARANVAYGLSHLPRAERDARVASLLARVDAAALADRAVTALSGGEKQRVALARALAPEPAVLLLDEPFAALDRARRAELVALLRALLADRRIPALHVTHDAAEALALGDRAVRIEDGRVTATGSVREVIAQDVPLAPPAPREAG